MKTEEAFAAVISGLIEKLEPKYGINCITCLKSLPLEGQKTILSFAETSDMLDAWALKHIAKALWAKFGDVPMNPETECIETQWQPTKFTSFEAGTEREYIWYWFEETFNVSVGADLMGREFDPSWVE